MLTGAFDISSVEKMPHLRPANGPIQYTHTQAAHITSESTDVGISDIGEDGPKVCVCSCFCAGMKLQITWS